MYKIIKDYSITIDDKLDNATSVFAHNCMIFKSHEVGRSEINRIPEMVLKNRAQSYCAHKETIYKYGANIITFYKVLLRYSFMKL